MKRTKGIKMKRTNRLVNVTNELRNPMISNRIKEVKVNIMKNMAANAIGHNKYLKGWIEQQPLNILFANVHPRERAFFEKQLDELGITR